jgi:CheY-like chemotaxis protein
MDEGSRRILIVDLDADTLISLQHVLEDAGLDTTITWDENEAGGLLKGKPFDLVLVGDHPPELKAETLLREFRSRDTTYPCLILRGSKLEGDFGDSTPRVIGVVPKWDPLLILEEVRAFFTHRATLGRNPKIGVAETNPRQATC